MSEEPDTNPCTTCALSADAVIRIVKACLHTDEELAGLAPGEVPPGALIVDAIVTTYGFHAGRIEAHAAEIAALLYELPDDFHARCGGGMSFLSAAFDRHGNRWAEHPTMGALFALGQAAELVACLVPREMWKVMPGGMPYYQVAASVRDQGRRFGGE